MSKKNKKKLRKLLRQQAQKSLSQNQESGPQLQNAGQVLSVDKEGEVVSKPQLVQKDQIQSEDSKEVRHEIKKILLTMAILIIVVIGVYFINIKTDFILKLGEFSTKVLNINV